MSTITPQPQAGRTAPPQTLYRTHVTACEDSENSYTFDFMADYLTMMAILERSLAHLLATSCDLTTLQYRMLLQLQINGAQQVSRLARKLSVGLSTASAASGKLAEGGLLQRLESPNDMRAVELQLTDKGRTVTEQADAQVASMMSDYWHSLTRDQLKAALTSSVSAVERHSSPRLENGKVRLDTALVDTVFISRSLTAKALQACGLTTNDFRVALALRILGEQATATEVASFLFLNSCDITPCLKHLEALGLITRERCSTNRRMRHISLTEQGRRRVTELMPVVFDALHETCHSDDALIAIHISAARDLVARRRSQSPF